MMDKLSVIIPTLQVKLKILNKLLLLLEQDKIVDEIVLINNSEKEFFPEHSITKLKIYNQTENLFVNKSWNLGIELIKNDYFLIINDDILFAPNFCSAVMSVDTLYKKNTGLVGLNIDDIKSLDPLNTNEEDLDILDTDNSELRFVQLKKYLSTDNWGSAFWGNKANYYRIPDKFKVIYGDNYLLKMNLEAGKKNYAIKNLKCIHIASSTSSLDLCANAVIKDLSNAYRYF